MAGAVSYDDDYETDSDLGVDSDVESDFTATPTDEVFDSQDRARHFSANDLPQWRQAGTKAQEAWPRAAKSTPNPAPTHTRWSESEAPMSNTEAPPPDYEAVTASRPYGQRFYHETNMPSNNHSPSSQAPSFTPQGTAFGQFQPQSSAPQSMSDPALIRRHLSDEETGLLTGVRGKRRQRRWLFCLKKLSVCNILLAAVFVVTVLLAIGASDSASESGSNGDPDQGGASPNDPPGPALPPEASAPASAECPYEYYSETQSFSFSRISNFSFVELMEGSDWISGGIKGTVNVQPGLQNQSEDVRLSLSYATTKPWTWLASNFVKTEDSLMLQLPDLKKTQGGYRARPCMWVYVKIEVRSGVRLDGWELVIENLDVNVEDGLFSSAEGTEDLSVLEIGGPSTFNTIRGKVQVAYWSSRETRVDVISGSIKGDFALRDLLSLKSQSGSIDVVVDPKQADPEHTKPAEYIAQSRSGSIKSRFPSSGDIPEREYIARVEGQSSSISGSYILGSFSSYHTVSGSITLDLLPRFDRKMPSNLHTDTRSGHTKIKVLTHQEFPGEPWSEAHTSHKSTSTSGSIDVIYPQEWSGWIEGETISGSIDVSGKDVEIVSDERRGSMFKHLVARKGVDGHGAIGLKSVSGSLKVRVDEF